MRHSTFIEGVCWVCIGLLLIFMLGKLAVENR